MNQISRIEQARRDAKLRQEMEDRFYVIRKAWNLVEPSPYNRDPKWLRIAASRAAKAGRLPRHFAGESVLTMLFDAGYGRAIDHPAIERVDGVRRVILEPYESRCSMDTARRMAAEIAILLKCEASVSLCSWHYPGLTIRITLAPTPTFARVATVAPRSNGMTSQPEFASVGQQWPPRCVCHYGTQLKAWIVTRKAEAIRDRTVAGGKYPHLCRFAKHLYEALGSSLRIIAVDRPIEASIRSLQDRSSRHPGQWFAAGDDACDMLQRSLLEHRETFIQEHPEVPVHRINFARLTEDPETVINELIAYLGIEPTAEEIDSAIAHVNPELRRFG